MSTELSGKMLRMLRTEIDGGWEVYKCSMDCPPKPVPTDASVMGAQWESGDYKTITIHLRRGDE